MSSDATRIGDALLALAQGKAADRDLWLAEIHLLKGSLPASRNKPLVANACELLWAWRRGNKPRVETILDWWEWFAVQPFTAGEDLTPEEVYRSLMAYSALAAAIIAELEQHGAREAIRAHARAHILWLALGAGKGPGKKVVDHKLGDLDRPVILVGSGGNACDLPYISQAGKRGWIRNRDKKAPKTFLFADRVGLSVMLGQAAGRAVNRKLAPWQADLFKALQALAPSFGPWGLNAAERATLVAFLADPVDTFHAKQIAEWLKPHCPDLPFTFIRFSDGAVMSFCRRSTGSSTDACMIDLWKADGTTLKTSADDGLRADSPPQRGWDEGIAVACQRDDGTGPIMRIAKPGTDEVWRVKCDLGFVVFEDARKPGAQTPTAPSTPTNPAPTKPRRKPWWMRLFGL